MGRKLTGMKGIQEIRENIFYPIHPFLFVLIRVNSWFLFTREKEEPRINTNQHEKNKIRNPTSQIRNRTILSILFEFPVNHYG
jgi:hypothetical protein